VTRAAVVGPDCLDAAWLAEARRVLLPGRRLVIESERVAAPAGLTQLALGTACSSPSDADQRSMPPRWVGLRVYAIDQSCSSSRPGGA